MTLPAALTRRMRYAFHVFGLSCLGGAIFLQIICFTDIASKGYFLAIEQNVAILGFEVFLTGYATVYFHLHVSAFNSSGKIVFYK